jgi:hypothetical protein
VEGASPLGAPGARNQPCLHLPNHIAAGSSLRSLPKGTLTPLGMTVIFGRKRGQRITPPSTIHNHSSNSHSHGRAAIRKPLISTIHMLSAFTRGRFFRFFCKIFFMTAPQGFDFSNTNRMTLEAGRPSLHNQCEACIIIPLFFEFQRAEKAPSRRRALVPPLLLPKGDVTTDWVFLEMFRLLRGNGLHGACHNADGRGDTSRKRHNGSASRWACSNRSNVKSIFPHRK